MGELGGIAWNDAYSMALLIRAPRVCLWHIAGWGVFGGGGAVWVRALVRERGLYCWAIILWGLDTFLIFLNMSLFLKVLSRWATRVYHVYKN